MGIKGDKEGLPPINTTQNKYMQDVIGNKSDTTSGTSIVALIKLVDSLVDLIKAKTDNLPANTATELTNILNDTANLDKGLMLSGNINILFPDVDQPNSAIEFFVSNANYGHAENAEFTDVGQIDIYRFRKGVDAGWTSIVSAAAPAATGLGTLNYSYNFPNANWQAGDLVQIHVSSVEVTFNTKVFKIPRATTYAVLGTNQIIQDLVNGGRLDLLIDAIKAKTDLIGSGIETAGTFAYLDAGAEQIIKEVTNTKRAGLKGIWLELNNLTQDGTIKFYTKINGSDYREIKSFQKAFSVADADDFIFIPIDCYINSDFKFTYTEGADEGADRNIYYSLIYQDLEV